MIHRWRQASISMATAVALAAGACSSQETSPPNEGTTLATAPTTTTTTPTATSTTTPESTTSTTTPATTAPEPTSPPTTVAPPATGPPVEATVPIFVGGGDGGWLLLGSWSGTDWSPAVDDAGTPRDVSIAAGTPAVVASLRRGASDTAFGSPSTACDDGRTGPTVEADVAPIDPPGFGIGATALAATWSVVPRPVVVIDEPPAAYDAIASESLAGTGVNTEAGQIVQMAVSDLDGDGDEESIVVYEFIADAAVATPGDFSTAIVIDAESRRRTTLSAFWVEEGTEPATVLDRLRVIAVADLNGDARSEIVVQRWIGDTATAELFTYDGDATERVLQSSCA